MQAMSICKEWIKGYELLPLESFRCHNQNVIDNEHDMSIEDNNHCSDLSHLTEVPK